MIGVMNLDKDLEKFTVRTARKTKLDCILLTSAKNVSGGLGRAGCAMHTATRQDTNRKVTATMIDFSTFAQ